VHTKAGGPAAAEVVLLHKQGVPTATPEDALAACFTWQRL
jgi:hypothetical protein